jgi:hypothetical protein
MTLKGCLQTIVAYGPPEAFPFCNELLSVHQMLMETPHFNQDSIQRILPTLDNWHGPLADEIKNHLKMYS